MQFILVSVVSYQCFIAMYVFSFFFFFFQAALQKQQEDAIVLSTLEASEVSAPSSGEEAPTLNGQADSTADSLEREPDLEPADEVTENGPTGELLDRFYCLFILLRLSVVNVNLISN